MDKPHRQLWCVDSTRARRSGGSNGLWVAESLITTVLGLLIGLPAWWVVNSMAKVDYGSPPEPPRVYFTSHTRGANLNTLWCFELSSTPPVFAPC